MLRALEILYTILCSINLVSLILDYVRSGIYKYKKSGDPLLLQIPGFYKLSDCRNNLIDLSYTINYT
jgi:hypothetical protein